MMTQLDYSKPVKLKYPQPGKEDLVYIITSYNEETNRCYIQIQNLNKGDKAILFTEPVSPDDIENIGTKEKKTYKAAIVSILLARLNYIYRYGEEWWDKIPFCLSILTYQTNRTSLKTAFGKLKRLEFCITCYNFDIMQ